MSVNTNECSVCYLIDSRKWFGCSHSKEHVFLYIQELEGLGNKCQSSPSAKEISKNIQIAQNF